MIINRANLTIVFQAFLTAFNQGFRNAESYWEKVATMVRSTSAENKYGWIGQFPRLREWVGDRHVKSMETHDYSIKNKKFESTFSVSADHLEDDSYGILCTNCRRSWLCIKNTSR